MRCIVLEVLVAVLILSPVQANPFCPERTQVIKCLENLDFNGDQRMSIEEIQSAYDKFPWYIAYPAAYFGPPKEVMRKCDTDQDGFITATDMRHNNATCLATCFKLASASKLFC